MVWILIDPCRKRFRLSERLRWIAHNWAQFPSGSRFRIRVRSDQKRKETDIKIRIIKKGGVDVYIDFIFDTNTKPHSGREKKKRQINFNGIGMNR